MSQPTDEPNAKILPDPELNPLLNPLLAAHMGRWAEVYFTTQPEKRAEAVSQLVRELSNNSAPAEIAVQPTNHERIHETLDETIHEPLEDLREEAEAGGPPKEDAILICENCGGRNSGSQRFCGMCGSRLILAPGSEQEQIAEAAPTPRWDAPTQHLPGGFSASDADSAPDSISRGNSFASERPWLRPTEESPAEFPSLSQYQPEPPSHNYKIYVGAAVAIILALLVYSSWRSNTAFWSSGSAPSALPRAVPAPSDESAAPPSKPPETATARPPASDQAQPPSSAVAQKQPNESAEDDRGTKASPAPRIVPVSVSAPSGAAEQNGAQELVTAEKYLDSGPGKARDSQQAASWLWKAVAKKNLTAALLLSDLYLRGDGVTKSCDQARLLLYAAARKGGAGAAERLRNLPAFGCQ